MEPVAPARGETPKRRNYQQAHVCRASPAPVHGVSPACSRRPVPAELLDTEGPQRTSRGPYRGLRPSPTTSAPREFDVDSGSQQGIVVGLAGHFCAAALKPSTAPESEIGPLAASAVRTARHPTLQCRSNPVQCSRAPNRSFQPSAAAARRMVVANLQVEPINILGDNGGARVGTIPKHAQAPRSGGSASRTRRYGFPIELRKGGVAGND